MSDQIDFQNGLGDLLRENERVTFSWLKSIIVFLSFSIILVFFAILVFQVFKKVVVLSPAPVQEQSHESAGSIRIEKKERRTPSESTAIVEVETATPTKTSPAKADTSLDESKTAAVSSHISSHSSAGQRYRLIAGSFRQSADAKQQIDELKRKGIQASIWSVQIHGIQYYRVQVGEYPDLKLANARKTTLSQDNIDSFIVPDAY